MNRGRESCISGHVRIKTQLQCVFYTTRLLFRQGRNQTLRNPMTDTPDTGPEVSRRETLGLLGVGSIAIPGGITALNPEVIVGHPQGRGAPVSTEQTITDEGIEYRPSSDTVKWVKLRSEEGPVAYETEPFEKWADRRCAAVGSDIVLPTIQTRVDKELQGVGKGASGEIIGLVITVHIGSAYDRDGNVLSEPNISVETLLDVTPRTVQTTIKLKEREHFRSVPVFVEESDIHET